MSVTMNGRAARLREWLSPHRIRNRWDARRLFLSGTVLSVVRGVAMLSGVGRRPGPKTAPPDYREGERWRRVAWWLRCQRIMLRSIPVGVGMHWELYKIHAGRAVLHPGRECCEPDGRHWRAG